MSGLSPVEPSYPVIKRLLENLGTCWLFEVHEGQRITYSTEQDDRCWRFNLLSSARTKFEREVSRLANGGMRPVQKNATQPILERPNWWKREIREP
jgi:hypothetical protein